MKNLTTKIKREELSNKTLMCMRDDCERIAELGTGYICADGTHGKGSGCWKRFCSFNCAVLHKREFSH